MDRTVRLELVDPNENVNKFWQISIKGSQITKQWGRIGTLGQTKMEGHPNSPTAEARFNRDVQSKVAKGYSRVSESDYGQEARLTEQEITVSKDNLQMMIESL